MSARLEVDALDLEGLLSPQLVALAELAEDERRDWFLGLSAEARQRIKYLWPFWARPDQIWRPGFERITLVQSGRGWGKTRYGAEATKWVAGHPEECGFGRAPLGEGAPIIALVGRTAHDCIATMINAILACSPPWFRPHFKSSEQLLVWPNGMRAYYFSAETPESLRGPQIGFCWGDEIAFYKPLRGERVSALENIEHALRGAIERAVYTTTPLPTAEMFALHERTRPRKVKNPLAADDAPEVVLPADVRLVRGSSLDNAANQGQRWVTSQRAKRGTRIGRQEVDGELLSGNARTMFPYELLNARRVQPLNDHERVPGEDWPAYLRRVLHLERICVAVDPAGSEDPENAETGIQVVGLGRGREYSLADLSGHHAMLEVPGILYDAAIAWRADAIVAETNFGGDMIAAAMETHVRGLAAAGRDYLPVQFVGVSTGRNGKAARLKVFAQHFDLELVYSVGEPAMWAPLEAQLHAFDPSQHPDKQVARVEVRQRDGSIKMETLLLDRMDARVWAHLYLTDHEIARGQSVFWLGGDMARRAADMLGSLR